MSRHFLEVAVRALYSSLILVAFTFGGCSSPTTNQDAGHDGGDGELPADTSVPDGDADADTDADGDFGDADAPCTDVSPSLVCPPCTEGFRESGSLCADIDECQESTHSCLTDDDCVNTPGSFLCGNCPPGYVDTLGDGTACEDIDECVTDNGGCDPLTTCTNTEGDRTCGDCPDGYQGTGETGCLLCPDSSATVRNEASYDDDMVFLVSGASWRDVLSLVPITTWTGEDTWCRRSADAAARSCLYPTLVYHQEGDMVDGDSLVYFLQQYEPSTVVTVGETPDALSVLLTAGDGEGAGLTPDQIRPIGFDELPSHWSSTSQVVYVDDDYELALLAATYAAASDAPLVIEGGRFDGPEAYCDKHLICVGTSTPEGEICDERYSLDELRARYVEVTATDKVLYLNPGDLTDYHVTESFGPELSADFLSEIYGRNSLAAPFLAAGKEELILSHDDPSFEAVDTFIETELAALDIVPSYLTIVATPDAVAHMRGTVESADRFYAALFDTHFPVMAVGRIYGITVTDVSSTIARSLFYSDLYDNLHPGAPHATYSANIATSQDTYPGFLDENGYLLTCTGWRITGGAPAEEPCTVLADRISDLDLEHATLFLNASHGGPTGVSIGPDTDGVIALNAIMLPVMRVPFVSLGACSTADFYGATRRAALLPTNFLRKGAIGFFGSVSLGSSDEASRILSEIFVTGASVGEAVRRFTSSTAFVAVQSEAEGTYVGYTLIGDPTLQLRHQVTTMNGVDVADLEIRFVEDESSLVGDTYSISGTITDTRQVSISQTPSSSRWYSYQRIVDLPSNYTLIADSLTLVEFQGASINVPFLAGGDARERVIAEWACPGAPDVVETLTTTAHEMSRLEHCYSWWDELDMCFYGGPAIYATLCGIYDVYPIDRGTHNEWWVVFPNGYNYATDHEPKVLEITLQFRVD